MNNPSRRKSLSRLMLALAACLLFASPALAQVEGPNGHFYQVVLEPGITWHQAKLKAEEAVFNGVHGHLATITSAEEDQFIESLRQQVSPGGYNAVWIGGHQDPMASTATGGWHWVNGEGPIPMNGDEGYANWQAGEPNDYSGQPEDFLSTGHFNQFGWNDESGQHLNYGYVVEFPSGGRAATVTVEAIDPIAVEIADATKPFDPAVFEFARMGDLTLDLPIFYSIHGSARNGIDYDEIPRSIIIPAGQASVHLTIIPRADALAVVEPMETVGIRIEPSLILTPEAAYNIDLDNREAAAVIYEGQPPEKPTLEIAVPRIDTIYKSGELVKFVALLYVGEPVSSADFYHGDILIGSVQRAAFNQGLSSFEFAWNGPAVGSPDIHAEATVNGVRVKSSPVRIIIEPTPETPVVSIRYVDVPVSAIVPTSDYTLGHLEVTRTGPTTRNLQVFYSVAGTATADVDYERLQGYVVIGAGRTTARINIAVKDDLIDEPTETVVVSLVPLGLVSDPAPSNYIIDPEKRSATVPIFDNDPPAELPIISLQLDPAEISEPNTIGFPIGTRVTVNRTGSLQFGLRVYLTYDGTATPNEDYGRTGDIVVIAPGSSNMTFNMAATPDLKVEGTETAIIRVIPPPPITADPAAGEYGIHPERGSATLKIHDAQSEPVLPVVSVWGIRQETREPGPTIDVAPAVFALRRSGFTNSSLTVSLTYRGTASNGVDYPTPPRFVGFKPGEREVRVEIYPNHDTVVEGNETIQVNIDPSPAVPPQYAVDPDHKSVPLIIVDNDFDTETVVSIEATDPIATELTPMVAAIDPARFVISRTGGDHSRDERVFFSIHGTAKNGEDYVTLPNSVVIPADESSVAIHIVPLSDGGGGGNTTHHYQFVSAPNTGWNQARALAEDAVFEGVKGHLATITSAEEDQLIDSLRQENGGGVFWVGGYQEPGELSITEGWKWVNNEGPISGSNFAGSYANWLAGEPNDYWGPGSENYMVIGWLNSFGWNDQHEVGINGYIVEFDLAGTNTVRDEKMETVALRLEPSPLVGPLPGYTIDPQKQTAVAVIFEHSAPADGAIEVAYPSAGAIFEDPDDVHFYVAAYHPSIDINRVSYEILGTPVGVSELNNHTTAPPGGLKIHRFRWEDGYRGTFVLQAKATLPNGQILVSSQIPFQVRNEMPNEHPVVHLLNPTDGAVFIVGDPIEVRAEGSDRDGTVIRMTLQVDGEQLYSTNGPVLRRNIEGLVAGPHRIEVRATDNLGAGGIKAINILVRHPDSVSFVERRLPASYSPGIPFEVQLRAAPRDGTHAYAVEDKAPQGWAISAISHEGVFDPVTGKVKFGPYTDAVDRILTYRVTPPQNATGRHQFVGKSSANGAAYPITGDEFIELIQQHHPADQNQNFAIILEEITAYAAAWKAGQSWPTGPVPIPVSYVTSAGRIWKRGEQYYFDPSRGPAPACWVPQSDPISGAAFTVQAISSATRLLSGEFKPGIAGTVQIQVSPAAGTSCYALEEKPPRGWLVSNISHGGVFDAASGTIRWGAFVDATARTVSYTVTPPIAVTAVGSFSGHLSYDGRLTEVGSETSVVVGSPITITSSQQTSAGITLEITGPAGQTAVIERSTDFVEWTNISSIFIPQGTVEFTDTSAPPSGHSFYRLRVL
jgi:hypothetical protein